MVGYRNLYLVTTEAATKDFLLKKGVLKNFANFTGRHVWWSLFLIKLQAFKNDF